MSGDLNLRPDHDDLQDAKIRALEKNIQPKSEPPMDDDEEKRRPLSGGELAALRDMLDRDKRATWLWASLRVWALWLAAVLGAWALGWEALGRLVRTLSKGE